MCRSSGYFVRIRPRRIDWVNLGPVEGFIVGETRMVTFDNPLRQPWDGVVSRTPAFTCGARHQDGWRRPVSGAGDQLRTLGCPVSWFPQSGLFMCPCHGGVYYADGSYASGPPPRGLFHAVWRVTEGAAGNPGAALPHAARHATRQIGRRPER